MSFTYNQELALDFYLTNPPEVEYEDDGDDREGWQIEEDNKI